MTAREPLDLSRVERLLVVKLSSLGDVVHATPVLRAFRAALPSAHITLAVDRAYVPLIARCPWIDAIVPAAGGETRLARWREAAAQLGERTFDLAVDLQGSPRSARWINASRSRVRAGRAAPGSWAWRANWDRVIRPDPHLHAVEVCAGIGRALGLTIADLTPALHWSEQDDAAAAALLAEIGAPARDYLIVNPFSRWPSKAWPVERYALLIAELVRATDAFIVITGGPQEQCAGTALAAKVGHERVLSVAGMSPLGVAMGLYRRARLMVTGDSGPMHVAAALGTPVVALFGPTWPQCVGPVGEGHVVIQCAHPPRPSEYRHDPEGHYIRAIPVELASRTVIEAWARTAAPGLTRPPANAVSE